MKDSILEFIKDPGYGAIIACLLLIYAVIVIALAQRYRTVSATAERVLIVLFVFCSLSVRLTPFTHWNLKNFITPPTNGTITYAQLALVAFFFLCSGDVIPFLKRRLQPLCLASIKSNCFLWIVPILAVASVFWSNSPVTSLKAGLILLFYNLFSVYIVNKFTWASIAACLRLIFFIVGTSSFFIFSGYVTNDGGDGGGLAGILASKNSLGYLMSLAVVVYFIEAYRTKKGRLFNTAMALFSGLVMLSAKSGGAMALLFGLVVLTAAALLMEKLNVRYIPLVSVLLAIGFVAACIFVWSSTPLILNALGEDTGLTGRDKIWGAAWTAIRENFWLGLGPYSFWQPWKDNADNPSLVYLIDQGMTLFIAPHAHQGFLDVMVDLGFLGLMAFAGSLVIAVNQARSFFLRTRRLESFLPLLLIAYVFIQNISESRLLKPNFVWLTYTVSVVALSCQGNLAKDSSGFSEKLLNRYQHPLANSYTNI